MASGPFQPSIFDLPPIPAQRAKKRRQLRVVPPGQPHWHKPTAAELAYAEQSIPYDQRPVHYNPGAKAIRHGAGVAGHKALRGLSLLASLTREGLTGGQNSPVGLVKGMARDTYSELINPWLMLAQHPSLNTGLQAAATFPVGGRGRGDRGYASNPADRLMVQRHIAQSQNEGPVDPRTRFPSPEVLQRAAEMLGYSPFELMMRMAQKGGKQRMLTSPESPPSFAHTWEAPFGNIMEAKKTPLDANMQHHLANRKIIEQNNKRWLRAMEYTLETQPGRYRVERLPNNLIRVDQRGSGLTFAWNTETGDWHGQPMRGLMRPPRQWRPSR